MRIKDYEENQRKIVSRSDKPKKTVLRGSGYMKKSFYDEGRVDLIEQLLQWQLNELFLKGYLTNEIKVSVGFKEQYYGDSFAINLKVLE